MYEASNCSQLQTIHPSIPISHPRLTISHPSISISHCPTHWLTCGWQAGEACPGPEAAHCVVGQGTSPEASDWPTAWAGRRGSPAWPSSGAGGPATPVEVKDGAGAEHCMCDSNTGAEMGLQYGREGDRLSTLNCQRCPDWDMLSDQLPVVNVCDHSYTEPE